MQRNHARCSAALLAVLAFVGLVALTGCGSGKAERASTGSAFVSTPTPTATATATASAAPKGGARGQAAVPQRVRSTLARIDAGTWPPDDGSGTQGGRNFGNFERLLPVTANGKTVKYTEWDVNTKKRGRGRDAERIVTGSDGSAWYSLDHYKSFARIR